MRELVYKVMVTHPAPGDISDNSFPCSGHVDKDKKEVLCFLKFEVFGVILNVSFQRLIKEKTFHLKQIFLWGCWSCGVMDSMELPIMESMQPSLELVVSTTLEGSTDPLGGSSENQLAANVVINKLFELVTLIPITLKDTSENNAGVELYLNCHIAKTADISLVPHMKDLRVSNTMFK
ncbi:hypothetical protein FRX31_035295 [Thalictrum thalictroides]|uniref:Uncharacterized protein n=1 Tax=Thalictrum thalictroides TaxID=46969 RepID=A0A7J6URF2_THATH|nr:hypothetical protein FRX31_035295 [Thalictrum thalictroides]